MTGRRFWTEKDKEAQRAEDDKARRSLAELVGCGGEGCLAVTSPVLLLAAFWYFG